MSERLSAKQIKQDIREDEVQSFLITAIERFQEKPSLYLGLIGGVFGVGILIAVGGYMMEQSAIAAQDELASAIRVFEAPIVESDAKPDDEKEPSFASEEDRNSKAAEKFASVGGSVGGVADLYEATLAVKAGDTTKAREIWESFVKSNEDHVLAVSVRLNLLALDRAEGNAQAVADKLQQELDGTAKTLPEDVLLFELARTREVLGENDKAKELYERILEDYPSSAYAADARKVTSAS